MAASARIRARVQGLAALMAVAVGAPSSASAAETSAAEATAPAATRPIVEALHVVPGATCVQAPALAQEIASWLGTDAIDAGLQIDVTGSPEDPRTIAFQMARGEEILAIRRFAPGPEACDHLEAAVGLAIALVVRASLVDEVTGAVVPVHPPAPPIASLPWAIAVDGLFALGTLPGTALGVDARIERSLPPNFVLRLGVVSLASGNNGFDQVPGTFDAAILALRFDACVALDVTSRAHLHACIGVLGGALGASGQGFAESREGWTAWGASATAAGVQVDLSPAWSVEGEASVVLPFERTDVGVRLETGGVAESRQIGATGGVLSIGPLYRF